MSKNNRNQQPTTTPAPVLDDQQGEKQVQDSAVGENQEGTNEGPMDGELPANPNGEGSGGETKEAVEGALGDNSHLHEPLKPGLAAEVNEQNEVVDVKQAEAAIDLAADGVQLSAFQTRMAWIAEHGTTHEQYVKNVLTNYVQVCLTSIDLEKIAVEQKRLWRLFAYLHAHPQEFSKLYNIVIEFGREYREQLFNLHMFYRAQEGLALGADEMQCFNNLRTLVLNTIESKSKQQVKMLLDIKKIVQHDMIPEHVRGMYVAFYQ